MVFSPLPELVPPLLVDELLLLFDPLLVPELELPDPLETTIVMVDPAVAEVADCEMTLPFATELLASVVTVTPKPAFLSALSAEYWSSPKTLGTETEDGPVETVMVTVLPLSALVPTEGFVLMTLPFSTLDEEDWVTLTSKPALWSALVALDWDSPTTLGTGTCSAPCER